MSVISMLAGYLVAFYEKLNWKHIGLFAIILIFICIPIILFTIGHSPISQSRFNRISLFSQGYDFLTLISVFLGNWVSHFSPYFLFLKGDINLRHSVPSFGLLYLFELPLLITGIWVIIRSKNPFHRLLLIWILIFPIASSLTIEGIPHALRSICVLPLPAIIGAIGLITAVEGLSKKLSSMNLKRILLISYTLMSFISIGLLIRVYFMVYPVVSAIPFQYGMREMVQYINQNHSKYDQVYISPSLGFPEIFFYFYNRPLASKTNQYLSDNHITLMNSFNFPDSNFSSNGRTRNLVVSDPADLIGVNSIFTINSPQGYPIIVFNEY